MPTYLLRRSHKTNEIIDIKSFWKPKRYKVLYKAKMFVTQGNSLRIFLCF